MLAFGAVFEPREQYEVLFKRYFYPLPIFERSG